MKNIFFALAAVLVLGRAGGADAAVQVVSTITDFASIAQAVGGEDVHAVSLTPGSRDPHFAVAKPSMIRTVSRADLLLLIGADMEIGWLPPLLRRGRNANIQLGTPGYLDLSMVIPLLEVPKVAVTRAMGDVHPKGNPHYWLDPRNGARIARAIAGRLAEIDPAHADAYRQRLNAFLQTLKTKYAGWRKQLAPLRGRPVLAYHSSMAYLASAFGFYIADEVEPKPGIAPSASYLNQLLAKIRSEHIELLVMEPFYERRSGRFLHEKTGIHVVVIPQSVEALPGINNYFDLFDGIVARITNALGA